MNFGEKSEENRRNTIANGDSKNSDEFGGIPALISMADLQDLLDRSGFI
jgi:hypothetical protein